MPTSLKPVFIASILIALALFLLIMNSGSQNQAPTFIWVMTVWYMYKHDYQALVTLQTIMMGISGLGTVIIVIASIQQDTTISNLLGLSPSEMIIIGIISSCAHLWLFGFFKRQLLVDSDFTADNTASGGGDKVKGVNDIGFGIWEAAAEEYDNNRNAGIWAMAFAESDGNEDKAKALYLKTRAEQLGQPSAGLAVEDVEWLVEPIKASLYMKQRRISEKKLLSAIERKKLRAVKHEGVLWVQNKSF